MATYYTLLTPAGLAKVANAQLTNQKIELSEVAAGDGNGVAYQPVGNENALKREVWRGGVASVEIDTDNLNWIVVEAVIPASAGGFSIREVGLFDTDGVLIAIGNYPDTYKPVIADGSTMDLALRTIIEIGNTSNVTLKVDPNVIVASRKYVDDKVQNSMGALSTRVTNLDNKVDTGLAGKIDTAEKGLPTGVAPLDSEGLVPRVHLPLTQGTWELINKTTLGSAINFIEIPDLSTFKKIKISGQFRHSSSNANLYLTINNRAEGHHYNRIQFANTYSILTNFAQNRVDLGGVGTGNNISVLDLDINNDGFITTFSTLGRIDFVTGTTKTSTSHITQSSHTDSVIGLIRLSFDAGSFAAGSKFEVWGIR